MAAPNPNSPATQAKQRRPTAEASQPSSVSTHVPSRLPAKNAEAPPDETTPLAPPDSSEPKKAERKVSARPTVKTDDDDGAGESSDEVATAAVAKAESAFSDGRLASARMSATEAVAAARKASPDLKVRAFIILGKVELASEEFAAAERTFDRALAIDPKHPVARKGKERAKEAAANADQQ